MRLARGSHVGPYEVLSTLGSGGMADVYRARDTRLGREIALKVVNEALAGDPELVRRLEQEARLAGSLNHPNLVAVYDVGVHEGAPYFITELLKGESLRQRLSRGRVPVDTALDWGAQLALGLAAAHARGIVHRDVKPENVFVTSDGQVKLLDFGIAKLTEATRAEGPHGLLEETATPTEGVTRTGAVIGTPAYMSPEQVRGETVDARTDIFSLGAVLYEMVSGQRPFPGGSLMESGHAILHDDPAPLPGVAPALSQLIRRCLAKEPEGRIQSARDLAFALEMLRSDAEPHRASPKAGVRGLTRRSWWALVLFGCVGMAVVVTRLSSRPAPVLPVSERVTFRPVDFLGRGGGCPSGGARFTSDGRVVFNARSAAVDEIFERHLASASIHALGLENYELAAVSATNEFAVFREPAPGSCLGSLARVPGGGGTPQVVAENVVSADWSPSGELALVRHIGPRFAVEYPIGKTLFEVREPAWIESLRVSPRGDLLAFLRHPIGDWSGEAVIIDLEGKTRRTSRRWHRMKGLAWAPGDEVWYSAGDVSPSGLQAMPLRGAERSLYSALGMLKLHDISADGRVLVGQGFLERDITFLGEGARSPRSLAWNENDFEPRLSPDGRLVLFSAWGPQGRPVALLRKTTGAAPMQLGEGFGVDLSPDGRTALLLSGEVLTQVTIDGASRRTVRLPELEISRPRFAGGTDRAISFARAKSDSSFRLYSIDLGRGIATPVSAEGMDTDYLEVSPGARWAATTLTAGGQQHVAIVPLSGGEPLTLPERRVDQHVGEDGHRGLPLHDPLGPVLGPDLLPAGWASDDELWLARVDRAEPSSFELIRYDLKHQRALEKRTIASGGTAPVYVVHVTHDGKNLIFSQERVTGHLYVVRGLTRAH